MSEVTTIAPGDVVTCTSPYLAGIEARRLPSYAIDPKDYLRWHIRNRDEALCVAAMPIDVSEGQWLLLLHDNGLGWFYSPVMKRVL